LLRTGGVGSGKVSAGADTGAATDNASAGAATGNASEFGTGVIGAEGSGTGAADTAPGQSPMSNPAITT
jgi:hypothetical protein